jgi:diguanylate cyclase (GGDEF)-like protein/PAS domain S-box-containing protein
VDDGRRYRSPLGGFAALSGILAAVEVAFRGTVGDVAVDLAGAAAWVAVFVGVRLHQPRHPAVWHLLGGSIPAFTLGGVLDQGMGGVAARHPDLYLLPEGLFLAGYACLLAGVAWASLCMSPRGDRTSLLDTGILLVAVGAVAWVLVLRPLLAAGQGVTAVLHPALDIALAAVIVRLVLVHPRHPWALWAIFASLASSLAADLGLEAAAAHGAPGAAALAGLVSLGSGTVLGLAALHPSMRQLTKPVAVRDDGLGSARLVALGVALLAAPAAVAADTALLGRPFHPADLLVPSAAVAVLVLARLSRLFHERERSERLAARRERWYRALVENQSDHVLVVGRDGTVVYQSPSVSRLLGYAPGALVGADLGRFVHPSDRDALAALLEECVARPGEVVHGALRGLDGAGQARKFEVALTNLADDEAVGGVVAVLHDVTERERFEEQLRHQALHDPLTGLPNRALVLDRAERMLAEARRNKRPVAALFIDLDNFKGINDSLGHQVGDQLLMAVATRLRHAVREADTVGRLGGDEFVVLVDDASSGGAPTLVAERIRDVLRTPFEVGGRRYAISASIGIAVEDQGGADDLLRNADIAMYRAKSEGRDRYVVFQPQMQQAAQDRLELEIDLQGAVRDGQLQVVYQPIVDLRELTVSGMEALVRWNHPTRGTLGPAEFIPLAEDSGLIVDIGRFVLREACRAAAGWKTDGTPLAVSVNVSTRQLESESLVEDVRAALREGGLDPGRLILEITETTIMRDAGQVADRIGRLKALGVRVAIDDFGTGYSSLSYLRQFPVDVLKIDRSFIASIQDSAEAVAVVRTLVQLGKTLDLEVVAEGIELEAQLDALRREGCDTAQGYLFGRPLDAAHLELFLRQWALGAGPRPRPAQRRAASGRPSGS